MRPRRSQRSKRPSSQALEALVSFSPQRPRRQSAALDGGSASPAHQPSLLPEAMASPSSATTATPMPTAATHDMLASTMLEQLVSLVSDEVSRRLQPLLGGQISQPAQDWNPVSSPVPVLPGESSHSTEFRCCFSSTNCLATSCATSPCAVHFGAAPGIHSHSRYRGGASGTRWGPDSLGLPVRSAVFAPWDSASQGCFLIYQFTNWRASTSKTANQNHTKWICWFRLPSC